MVSMKLVMIAGGIALSLAVSDPFSVTLRWLRLGGVVAVSLLAVAAVLAGATEGDQQVEMWGLGGCALLFVVQLVTVQMGWRRCQRAAAGAAYFASTVVAWMALRTRLTTDAMATSPWGVDPWLVEAGLAATVATTAGLLGGFLMAMLLGHAFLTADGEMTQAPFARLVWLLTTLLMLRLLISGLMGWWPYQQFDQGTASGQIWNTVLIIARYAVGFFVPSIFIYMIHDCVRRRANQSATGILYVATVLVVLGEGLSLTLWRETGYFF